MKIPLHPTCKVIRADASGLLAIDKAPGVLSHPNSSRDQKSSVLDLPYDMEQEGYLDDGKVWYLLHRLDGPTSGILLLSDQPKLAMALKEAFANHQVEKTYVALVKGVPGRKRDIWRDCLVTSNRGGTLRTSLLRGKSNAETRMELLKRADTSPARALITLRPLTGKTHQLRVQCAHRHMPIVGDATYGDFSFNRGFRRHGGEKRMFLHSSRIRLEVEISGQKVAFSAESPLPEAFTVALK